MWAGESPVIELDSDECMALLRTGSVGRLAVSVRDDVEIFPVNYVLDGDELVFRTAPGTKLLELTINAHVAFEIDGSTEREAWSVVLKGAAREIDRQSEIDAADRLPLVPWIPTLKYRYVRLTPSSVTGRRFERAPEPERYA